MGIVAVSLFLSGALTWFLVINLELTNAQDQLNREVISRRSELKSIECQVPSDPSVACTGRLVSGADFEQRIASLITPSLGENRLLMLDRQHRIVYDSASSTTGPSQLSLGDNRAVGRSYIQQTTFALGGSTYLGAAMPITPARDPLGAAYVVLARSHHDVTSHASADLFPRLLVAGGASLLLALALALLLSRAMARPLSELAGAAEDIADGNYGRRVRVTGRDEIGMVGRAFNRMAEAVERARTLQRDFLADVSHELKTPLTSLIGFSQALVDGSLDTEEQKRRAATILHEEAERVLRMAQELLDLAKVESGHISIHPQEVDLAAMMDQEIEIIRRRAEGRGLRLAVEIPSGLGPATADPERLHQILENLLDNAAKYATEGTMVSVAVTPGDGDLTLTVANQLGVHRPDPDRMFHRFYRADPSRASGAGGVGLGLAISQELAIAMGGRLWATLDSGKDRLEVHLRLPVKRSPSAAAKPAPEGTGSAPGDPVHPLGQSPAKPAGRRVRR